MMSLQTETTGVGFHWEIDTNVAALLIRRCGET